MPRTRKPQRERPPKYEEVLFTHNDFDDLHQTLVYLRSRDTGTRLYQRLLTAMEEALARSYGLPSIRFTVEK